MASTPLAHHQERPGFALNGPLVLLFLLALIVFACWLFFFAVGSGRGSASIHPALAVFSMLLFIACMISLGGFFTLQPNEARVLILFGAYKGTVRTSGFHWANPFYANGATAFSLGSANTFLSRRVSTDTPHDHGISKRNKVSLRARTLNIESIKVNDKRGNPIQIGTVVVWRIADTARALFDVDSYESFVSTQSETALRHLASQYAYDYQDSSEVTLGSGVEEVSAALCTELQARLSKAGVVVDEARLTQLSYAPEIAQAMLRRQQAEAVIAARQKIVQGAVGMVEMALYELESKHVVDLDPERKAAMVSNLLVVLCGEADVQPVLNTGTLYT